VVDVVREKEVPDVLFCDLVGDLVKVMQAESVLLVLHKSPRGNSKQEEFEAKYDVVKVDLIQFDGVEEHKQAGGDDHPLVERHIRSGPPVLPLVVVQD